MKSCVKIAGLMCLVMLTCGCACLRAQTEPVKEKRARSGEDVTSLKTRLRELIRQKAAEGVDVTKVEILQERAAKMYERGDVAECARLLQEGIDRLDGGRGKEQTKSRPDTDNAVTPESVALPVRSSQAVVVEFEPTDKRRSSSDVFCRQSVQAIAGKVNLRVGTDPIFVIESGQETGTLQAGNVTAASPFGISALGQPDERLKALGALWVRHETGVKWDLIEQQRGNFDWSATDRTLNGFTGSGIHLMVNVSVFNRWDQGMMRGDPRRKSGNRMARDTAAYQAFLAKAVARYRFVAAWQIENEPNSPEYWNDTPENYVTLLRAAYSTIKQANPAALVVMGGASRELTRGEEFWSKVFGALKKNPERCFDVFDCHWFHNMANLADPFGAMVANLQDARRRLDDAGLRDVPIWMTEVGAYSDQPSGYARYVPEKEQAGDLIKLHCLALASGVQRVFWVRLTDWQSFGGAADGYFDHTGLARQSKGREEEKLAFYAYGQLAGALAGCDWANARRMPLDGCTAVRFSKADDSSVYVLWRGGGPTGNVEQK